MSALSVGLHPGRLWGRYCTALETKPLRIKALTAAVGFALGDILAQVAVRVPGEQFRYDVLRTLRLAAYGGESCAVCWPDACKACLTARRWQVPLEGL